MIGIAAFSMGFVHSSMKPDRGAGIESGRIRTDRHSLPTTAKQIQVRGATRLNPT
jgi:hypothetical protein